ncbi:hypothetical protein NM688_g3234 [Phlebia brevispora]|uniref:Uncharacterized protein n=1 Tax=Phlebia brevispora TaxID=194682 RepID=A0ACC1T6I3_9APHY|nr:hypothetical protein NM688_g3234 [Phlebia brevispora]
MPIHDGLDEAAQKIRSLMKCLSKTDRAYQNQVLALIRECRKLQLEYQKLKSFEALLRLLAKVAEAVETIASADNLSTVLVREDYDTLYSTDASSKWASFFEAFKRAQQLDESSGKRLIRIKTKRKAASTEWPMDKTKTADIDFILLKSAKKYSIPSQFKSHVSTIKLMLDTVKLKFHPDSTFEEAIWCFTRKEHLNISLDDNVQFYNQSPERIITELRPAEKLQERRNYYVLLDGKTRIFVTYGSTRVYGNVYKVNDGKQVVFKEYNGTLLNSDIIRQSFAHSNTAFVLGADESSTELSNWELLLDTLLQQCESDAANVRSVRVQLAQPEMPWYEYSSASSETIVSDGSHCLSSEITMPTVQFPNPEPHLVPSLPRSSGLSPTYSLDANNEHSAKKKSAKVPELSIHPPEATIVRQPSTHDTSSDEDHLFVPNLPGSLDPTPTSPSARGWSWPFGGFVQNMRKYYESLNNILRIALNVEFRSNLFLGCIVECIKSMPSRDSNLSTELDIKYELPSLVKSLQEGWINTLTSSAVVSALFAGIQSQLLGSVSGVTGDSKVVNALLFFFWITFFLSISATISSLILTDEFSDISIRASRRQTLDGGGKRADLKIDAYYGGATGLLSMFNGDRRDWTYVMWHWLISTVFGCFAFVAQLALPCPSALQHLTKTSSFTTIHSTPKYYTSEATSYRSIQTQTPSTISYTMASRKNTGFTIGSHSTVADYNLPGTVKALQDGWSATFRTSAIVAALFAGVESVLIGFVKNAIQDEVGSSSRCGQALLAFTYLAFFLNLSAAMSSLLLTDEIGSIALRAARTVAEEQHTLDIDVYDERTSKLISRFNGGRRSWRWVMWHLAKEPAMTEVGKLSTDVNYKLPETVQALRDGWMLTFQSAAVVSALLASIESQLLGTVSDAVHGDGGIGQSTHSGRALLVITYLALFLSISATMSSLVLTQELSVVAVRSARQTAAGCESLKHDIYDESISQLLARFNGGRRSWQWVLGHCESYNIVSESSVSSSNAQGMVALVASYITLVIQLVLYVWCTEQSPVVAAVIFFGIISSLPLFTLFPWGSLLLISMQSTKGDSENGTSASSTTRGNTTMS